MKRKKKYPQRGPPYSALMLDMTVSADGISSTLPSAFQYIQLNQPLALDVSTAFPWHKRCNEKMLMHFYGGCFSEGFKHKTILARTSHSG
jgi:hypothetical protein